MPRRVSATDVKNGFGAIVDSVLRDGDEVIVENRGLPVTAIVPMGYRELERYTIEQRRKAALEKLRALQARVREKNPDLTADDVAGLAKRVVNDAVTALNEKHLAARER